MVEHANSTPEPLVETPQIHSPFSLLPEIVGDEDDYEDVTTATAASLLPLPSSLAASNGFVGQVVHASSGEHNRLPKEPFIDLAPHVSSQFYTFNRESYTLMVRCILERRLATPDEIKSATPRPVLRSWRSVWKDRSEGTAYVTAWKRIQDKLNAHMDTAHGQELLYFKNNTSQYVSHVDQWQDIVMSFHGDADLRHLGLKDTIDRIKQVWTVGAKFYGIPESFIRMCLASCPVCTGVGQPNGIGGSRSKRRRFEYTESLDVPAKDVPHKLQQLAAKHKVVLCIRQKYIRYKPFMAEVKDYACHRAGEPSSTSSKKSRVLKREPYASKRCGCGFRIRAIVPIANYNEKDKTFVYEIEGTAVFKLYAIHTGHEPGPLDGNARIIHRVVGHKGVFEQDPIEYGISEDLEPESYVSLIGKETGDDLQLSILQQVQELRSEAVLLESKILKMPREVLGFLSQELPDILHRIRSAGQNVFVAKPQNPDVGMDRFRMVMGDSELGQWDDRNEGSQGVLYDKDVELIEDDDTDFGQELPWEMMRADFRGRKITRESCKSEKWMMKDCCRFDDKSILHYCDEGDSKLIKPLRHDGIIETDPNLVGLQVDGFYPDPDSAKWYDSPNGLDPDVENCGDGAFRHGGIG